MEDERGASRTRQSYLGDTRIHPESHLSAERLNLTPPVSPVLHESFQGEVSRNDSNVTSTLTEPHDSEKSAWRLFLEKIVDSLCVQTLMALMTIYALFSDDVRVLAFSREADITFYSLTTTAMGLFCLEILISCLVRENYFNGFFFWLDVISTVSLVGDIGWIIPESSVEGETTTDIAKQIRTGRAARIIRLIRFIRLMRISKLYKEARQSREKILQQRKEALLTRTNTLQRNTLTPNNDGPTQQQDGPIATSSPRLMRSSSLYGQKVCISRLNPDPEDLATLSDETSLPQESQISKKLTDLTTQRVVVIILVLMIGLPLLATETYFAIPEPTGYATAALDDAYQTMNESDFATMCHTYSEYQRQEECYPLVYLTGPKCGPFYFGSPLAELRPSEQLVSVHGSFTAVVDVRHFTRLSAGLNIGKTVFLCAILALGAIVFSHDTTRLVLNPLESMLEKTRLLVRAPMTFCQIREEAELGMYSLHEKLENKAKESDSYETVFLEGLIVRIATLLAVEYGEAGAKIIAENLATGQYLNPMLPGNKIFAIFGFVIIVRFTDLTQVLQAQITPFVNVIAEVVHSTIQKYFGATNKNIGDAFLVCWKLPSEDVDAGEEGVIAKTRTASFVFDMALFAYLKIIAKIAKLKHVLKLAANLDIEAAMRQYKVQLGFGLHPGWAIEGAIGSVYKIDASYLSPNVNIAARLEAATKQYGVPLLMSGQVYHNLSPHVRKLCREIDTVRVKGSKTPLQLYTVDVETAVLAQKSCKYEAIEPAARQKLRLEKRRQFRLAINTGQHTSKKLYERDKDIRALVGAVLTDFLNQFQDGYDKYIAGNWPEAADSFRQALVLRPHDGPTLTLLKYIESYHCTSPSDWLGCRDLPLPISSSITVLLLLPSLLAL